MKTPKTTRKPSLLRTLAAWVVGMFLAATLGGAALDMTHDTVNDILNGGDE